MFNYPEIWKLIFYTGVTQADTIWISVLGLILFFLSIFIFPGKMRVVDVLILLGIVFSPASMLLYERANVDIFFFVLCTLVLILSNYSLVASMILIIIGMVFKMFPLFGVVVYLKERPKKFWTLIVIGCLAFAIYFVLSFDSFRAAWSLTQRGRDQSYGANVIALHYDRILISNLSHIISPEWISVLLGVSPYLIAFIVIAWCLFLNIGSKNELTSNDQRNLDAFRMGVATYAGTFLLGNNWDYRLAFLIFIVPQTAVWLRTAKGQMQKLAILTMLSAYLSNWYLLFYFILKKVDLWDSLHEILFLFDETANWTLFACLISLAFISAPEWIKAPVYKVFSSKQQQRANP
ncbi:MAG: hypothetical protein MUO77_19460 [Anaerolineales bacterium]|nr:hypothetical protein [Anaerolineales bacterium]